MAEEEMKKTEVEETHDLKGEDIETPGDEEMEKESEEEIKPEVEAPKEDVKTKFRRRGEETREEIVEKWIPKTKLGMEVKSGKIKNIDEILSAGRKILEPQIVDALLEIKTDLISIGQSKGKFGGGKRRAWRQTQRKKKEGNVATFSAFAVVGDENGHIGIGVGRAKETLPARDKAVRKAKLNLMKITRGDGSFDSVGGGNSSIPFKVQGKGGSVRVTLLPAAPGTGLVVGSELKKVLKLAGIKDVYSKTTGGIGTTFNFVKACVDALKKTNKEQNK